MLKVEFQFHPERLKSNLVSENRFYLYSIQKIVYANVRKKNPAFFNVKQDISTLLRKIKLYLPQL